MKKILILLISLMVMFGINASAQDFLKKLSYKERKEYQRLSRFSQIGKPLMNMFMIKGKMDTVFMGIQIMVGDSNQLLFRCEHLYPKYNFVLESDVDCFLNCYKLTVIKKNIKIKCTIDREGVSFFEYYVNNNLKFARERRFHLLPERDSTPTSIWPHR